MNIIFDSLGAQVLENLKTNGQRLETFLQNLEALNYAVTYTDPSQTISSQLSNQDLLITSTHQLLGPAQPPAGSPPNTIPAITTGYVGTDLGGIQSWISNGGSLLLFVNHSVPFGAGPFWPINDIQLAAALGITISFAEFIGNVNVTTGCDNQGHKTLNTLSMTPADIPSTNPASAIVANVSCVEAWDSGGISPVVPANLTSTVLIPLPASGCSDNSGLGFNPEDYAFSVLYTLGAGNVIVIGHSGILGNWGTCNPSPGQIESKDNLTFLLNCVAYLTGNS